MMKKYILLLVFLTQSFVFSQELKEVTLTQIGVGKTKDAAKYNALRNALEKAFGTFISSNTTIFKDELVKDEIISISSGNIQNFDILSETQLIDGSFSSVVKATVSIGKLTSFCESKGIAVEFKGGLFAANIKLQELNKKNEEAVMENLFTILSKIVNNGFDYSIEVSEPKKDTFHDEWDINFVVSAKGNKNLVQIPDLILGIINNLSLKTDEIESYNRLNLKNYSIKINNKEYFFRSQYSLVYLKLFFENVLPMSSVNFYVDNSIHSSTCLKLLANNINMESTKIPKYWPVLNSSKQDKGYDYGVKSSYFLLFNEYNYPLNNQVSKFILNINNEKMEGINGTKLKLDSFKDKIHKIDLNQLKYPNSIEICYFFKEKYPTIELEKIKEFKVQPIIK